MYYNAQSAHLPGLKVPRAREAWVLVSFSYTTPYPRCHALARSRCGSAQTPGGPGATKLIYAAHPQTPVAQALSALPRNRFMNTTRPPSQPPPACVPQAFPLYLASAGAAR